MTKKTITLEDFEAQRAGGAEPHSGHTAQVLLALEPLTPTALTIPDRPIRSIQAGVTGQWSGRGTSVAVQPIKGGAIRTSIIDDELYIVWYPSENGK